MLLINFAPIWINTGIVRTDNIIKMIFFFLKTKNTTFLELEFKEKSKFCFQDPLKYHL